MQGVLLEYRQLLQIMQERWKGNQAFLAEQLGISESKASRILNEKQLAPLELIEQMAAIVGIKIQLNFSYIKY